MEPEYKPTLLQQALDIVGLASFCAFWYVLLVITPN
jgi:hypothetical protein